MSMVEIVHLTRQELYDKAVAAVKEITPICIGPHLHLQDRLDDISFYLMACPPQEEQRE
jgi:hypothetical protein